MSMRVPSTTPPLTLERNSSGDLANSARIGTPPVGFTQWVPTARAQNWLLAGGSMQLASWGPGYVITSGSSATLRAYAWPRPQNYARMWTFVMQGLGVHGVIETADNPSGVAYATNPDSSFTVINVPELVTNTTPGGEEVSVVVTVDSSVPAESPLIIKSATCTEIPLKRAGDLVDAAGYGVHETSLDKWKQIAELDSSTTDQRSVTGVLRASAVLTEGQHALRRAKIFSWHLEDGVNTSSTTFANLFRIDPSCQTRQVLSQSTETVRVCRMAVYAAASASTGRVRITSNVDASTYTFNISSATPAWYESGDFNLPVDDVDEAGWVRGSRETITIEYRALSGDITVYGVDIGEE